MIESLIEYFKEISTNSVFQDWGVLGLFLNSLLSATAIPLPTEILTTSLIAGGESKELIIVALVLGSSIGGTLNYFIGFGGTKLFRLFKKKQTETESQKGHKWLKRLGWTGVFFSPFILVVGDLILISAGARKMDLKKFMLLMIAGKTFKAVLTVYGLGVLFG